MTLVTIGLPCYNNQHTILTAIRSVFAQTYPDWELIVVDDGSQDGTRELVSQIKDPRVKIISDGKNLGLAERLNQISQLARGEYLVRLDGDDFNHPHRLTQQIQYLRLNPEVDVVATPVYSINQENLILGSKSFEPLAQLNPKLVLLNKGLIIHPTIAAKTSWFLRYPYDHNYRRTQDRELWCRTSPHCQFAKLPHPLYFYRDSPSSPQTYLQSYLKAVQTNYKLLDTYGSEYLGWKGTLKQKAMISLKGLSYRFLTLIGQQEKLITQRHQPLGEEEQKSAQQIIDQILTTPLPGIEEDTGFEGTSNP